MNQAKINSFLQTVWVYYDAHGRDLPWRQTESDGSFDPYKIMVSEIMLQQTKASRVIPKYQQFLEQFPTTKKLASAELGEVLKAWNGLGYNRRAKFLHQAAQMIVAEYNGQFPKTLNALTNLPGIGVNSAGAILAYAFNQPAIFIETNIRTVYIHHFFKYSTEISDTQLRSLLTQTLDTKNPREFYWALMDYGSHLKTTMGNSAKQSKHYTKQSPFSGSLRQVRGHILRALATKPYRLKQLESEIIDVRLGDVLQGLMTEQLISKRDDIYHLG